MDHDLKAALIHNFSAPELIPTFTVSDESKVRFVVSGAAGGNTIIIRGRITGQDDWDTLQTITGTSKVVVDVKTYDEMQIECTVFAGSGPIVKVVASSFNPAGGSTVIDAPVGGSIDSDHIILTSSDNTISITNNPLTNTINLTQGGAGELSKYSTTFNNTSDWVLNGSNYEYTVLAATHGNKPNPTVHTYETIAGVDDVVYPTIIRSATNDIILQVTQVPDNRYTGRITII